MSTSPTPTTTENTINVNTTYKGERKGLVLRAQQNFKEMIEAVRRAYKIESSVDLDAKRAGKVINKEEQRTLKELNFANEEEIEIQVAVPRTV